MKNADTHISKIDLKNKKFISVNELIDKFEADENIRKYAQFKNFAEKYAKSKSARVSNIFKI